MKHWSMLIPLVMATAACSHTMPDYGVKSVPPSLEAIPGAEQVQRSEPPRSTLPVTLHTDLTPIQQAIERGVADRYTEADRPLGTDYRWTFVRDGSPQVDIQDGVVTVRAVYKGELESRSGARGCRLDPLYPLVETTGRLEVREEAGALIFRLADPRTLLDLKPESDARCNMFNTPIKDQLADLVDEPGITAAMQRAVEEGRFQIPLEALSHPMQGPVSLTMPQATGSLCLYGRAADIVVGPLKGPARQTTIPMAVQQSATAVIEAQCQSPRGGPVKVTHGSVAAEGQPYRVLTTVAVPYAALNQSLQDKLFHQQLVIEGLLKDKVLIDRVTASDRGGKTLLEVATQGDVVGKIYYWGTPQLEHNGTWLRIPDLRMATESKTMLDQVKVGYWQTIDEQLRPKLIEAASVDLGERLRAIRSAMNGQHRVGDLTVDLLMARYHPQRTYSTASGLMADVLLEGTASANGRLPVEAPRKEVRPPAAVERTPVPPERPSAPEISEAPAIRM